jgi:hypothetical protein
MVAVRRLGTRTHEADALIAGVGDIEIVLRVEADAHGTIQLGALGGATIAAQTRFARSGDHSDRASLQVYTTNLVSGSFRETEHVRRLERQPSWLMQVRQDGRDFAAAVLDTQNTALRLVEETVRHVKITLGIQR